jgi:hypothetical protein
VIGKDGTGLGRAKEKTEKGQTGLRKEITDYLFWNPSDFVVECSISDNLFYYNNSR